MEHQLGRHVFRVEGDVLFLRVVGDCSVSELKTLLSVLDRVVLEHGRWAVVADVGEMRHMDPTARHVAGQWSNGKLGYAKAFLGAGATTRAMLFLITRARELFTGRASNVAFVKTEAEGRAWVDAHREKTS